MNTDLNKVTLPPEFREFLNRLPPSQLNARLCLYRARIAPSIVDREVTLFFKLDSGNTMTITRNVKTHQRDITFYSLSATTVTFSNNVDLIDPIVRA